MTRADSLDADFAGGGMRSGNPTPEVFPPPEAMRPTLLGQRYMVSAGHPIAAHVAAQVFERGGNAIDAGVAGGLALAVVQADMCNLGGVAPIVVRDATSGSMYSLAGLGWWGTSATLEAFTARYGRDMPLGPAVGVVPAAVSAYVRALQRFGTWKFAACAEPAIELALEGFLVDQRLASALEITGRGFSRWPSSRAIYWPRGRPPAAGDRLVQSALGATLRTLVDAESGADRAAALDAVHDAFYRGDIAERIVAYAQRHGGWLERADLADFDATIEPAVTRGFAGWDVFTPDTWCQGPAMLQTLGILEGVDLRTLGHNSAEYAHTVAEATKLAFFDRERFYGDPRRVDVPLQRLLSDEHAAHLRAMIDPDRALPSFGRRSGAPGGRLDTTCLCTLDSQGNAFSAMPSDTLDGSPIVPELGLLISPRGVQSRLDADHPACIGPRRRPRLTPSPAVAVHPDDGRVIAFGCPGGDVILQGMLHAFVNTVVFGMSAQEAVEAPRFAAFAWPDSFFPHGEVDARVAVEARIRDDVAAGLVARGHNIKRWPEWEFDAGSVSIVMDARAPGPDGRVLAAGADPRRSAYAIGR